MGRTILAEGDARVGRRYLDVGLAVGDLLTYLVIDPSGHELGERAGEGNLAGDGEARRGANHIGLGDAALDEPFGKFFCEGVHLERTLEVRRQRHYPFVLPSRLEQPCSEAAPGVLLTCIDVFFHGSTY